MMRCAARQHGILPWGRCVAFDTVLIAFVVLLLSVLLTGLVRKRALRHGLIDVPNERSSHTTPTPRGGGIAIVLATLLAALALHIRGWVDAPLIWALVGGGLLVALVGYLDDRRQLSARIRLAAHFAAALWALVCIGGIAPLRFGNHVLEFGVTGYLIGAVGVTWVLNLFNFMDGIDGIAASEACFVSWASALLGLWTGASTAVPSMAIAFGAACFGFLLWNWSPAKIFMGDVGSGFTGYVIAVLALAAARENSVGLYIWLILGGVFFCDATVTLVRRLVRREQVFQAHRSHGYQNLARHWHSHRAVTIWVIVLNVFWLFPCAGLAIAFPGYAGWIAGFALAPLVLGVFAIAARTAQPDAERHSVRT